ncbi:hypothetical protein PV08_08681 [Exophiala spinifera]|uniref:ATP-dependent DNA ligase family profile domain-containing protein n=1 Tax=Exophiala spinifera TaxID=91928 RepID=A0A0D2B3P8_9EURO|nr:uncharacterized protein PV08_08681 [Exophiala spinifera]KIW13493.1 hypothetical protein PV08_08681 [Exophiala spinifera]
MGPQGFKFTWLCELLDTLDAARKERCLTSNRNVNLDVKYTTEWFIKYNGVIPRHGPAAAAFLSCLLPERLPKRSYSMQEAALANVWARIRRLPAASVKKLKAWKSAETDLATTVEHVFADFDDNVDVYNGPVTLEEIDRALFQLAANSAFSSPEIRNYKNSQTQGDILAPIVRRLKSSEAKWLVRMVLKRYTPVQLPERTVLRSFHFLLPHIMAVRNSIESAVDVLTLKELQGIPANPSPADESWILRLCAHYIIPGLGAMITRTSFVKARTIKHCCNEARNRTMSVERKYDGEYCQVHIDLTKEVSSQIQIFSKSGKDSTRDRIRLQPALRKGLRIGEQDCAFSRNCIVEGELLIYNRSTRSVMPFHAIRKHILHGGKPLGTEMDSPRKPDEQIMFVFYDIMFLDDMILSQRPHHERRKRLEQIVRTVEGESEVAYRRVINFSNSDARRGLLDIFANAIQRRWEGLVLKGCDDPYFSFLYSQSVLKLKKDYIKGCGDVVDLCVIGGRRDPRIIEQLQLGPLSWTTFYIACLENKEEVRRFDAKPIFRILQTVSSPGVPKEDILHFNAQGQLFKVPFANSIDQYVVWTDAKEMTDMEAPSELFKVPFIVEIMGAGFERPQNARYMVPRFPRVMKVHSDRTFLETSSFEEVQKQAEQSMEEISVQESQEEVDWIARLTAADGKHARFHSVSERTASPSVSTLSNSLNKTTQTSDTPCKIRPVSNEDGNLHNTENNSSHFGSNAISPSAVMASGQSQRRSSPPHVNELSVRDSAANNASGQAYKTSSGSPVIALRAGDSCHTSKRKLADIERPDEDDQDARRRKVSAEVTNISTTRSFGSNGRLKADKVSSLRHHPSRNVHTGQSTMLIYTDEVRPHTGPVIGSPSPSMSNIHRFPNHRQPFEPPAVFRPPSRRHRARHELVSQSTNITPPKGRQRRPLSDLSAGSTQRGRDELPDSLSRDMSDKENPGKLPSSGEHSTNGMAGDGPMENGSNENHDCVADALLDKDGIFSEGEKRQKLPDHAPRKETDASTLSETKAPVRIPQLRITDFASYILCSHWSPLQKELAVRNGSIPRSVRKSEFLVGRLLLARLLDCSGPEDIAKEIYQVVKTVSVLRSRLMSRGLSSSKSRPDSSRPRERRQRRLVVFYDMQALALMPTETVPCQCGDSQLCQSCLALVNSSLRYHFKGAVLFSTGRRFCPPEIPPERGVDSSSTRPGLDGNLRKDKLVADVITDWRQVMGLLESLCCDDDGILGREDSV